MDMHEIGIIKSGFSAVNENLTDIAKSLRKLTEKEPSTDYNLKSTPPAGEYVFVKVQDLYGDTIYQIPQIAKLLDDGWYNPYQPEPYGCDQNPFKIIGWKEIPEGVI